MKIIIIILALLLVSCKNPYDHTFNATLSCEHFQTPNIVKIITIKPSVIEFIDKDNNYIVLINENCSIVKESK